jgi:hypothetical protein
MRPLDAAQALPAGQRGARSRERSRAWAGRPARCARQHTSQPPPCPSAPRPTGLAPKQHGLEKKAGRDGPQPPAPHLPKLLLVRRKRCAVATLVVDLQQRRACSCSGGCVAGWLDGQLPRAGRSARPGQRRRRTSRRGTRLAACCAGGARAGRPAAARLCIARPLPPAHLDHDEAAIVVDAQQGLDEAAAAWGRVRGGRGATTLIPNSLPHARAVACRCPHPHSPLAAGPRPCRHCRRACQGGAPARRSAQGMLRMQACPREGAPALLASTHPACPSPPQAGR